MSDAARSTASVEPQARGLRPELLEMIAAFERENPNLMEALRIFGISSAEYEEAIRALNFAPTHTSTSTQQTI